MEAQWIQEEYNGVRFGFKVKQALTSQQSDFQKVDVVETESYGKLLLLDDMVMTTDRDEFIYHEMIAHVPLLSLPEAPKRVLVIGGGDGGTVREVLKHPSVEEVVLCEIDPMVVEVCKQYFPVIAGEIENPRCTSVFEDGVAYVKNLPDACFDAILIDSTDPLGPGEGLFTVDFYKDVARALKPNGIMASQSESPFYVPEGIEKIYTNLRQAFPIVSAYWGVVPTYPGALWSWSFCSKSVEPKAHFNEALANQLAPHCQYFTPALYQGCFALPALLHRLVKPTHQ
jgi:spermidine synthase